MNGGKNLSDHFALPIASEAPRYDVYRITPKLPTEVFVTIVAPTSELNGLITKNGGAAQALVPNRQLFGDPVHVRSVDNMRNLTVEVERGAVTPNLVRGASALGAAAMVYDATATATHASELQHQGNAAGAQSDIVHFGSRNLGALGGAALGAEIFGMAGLETGPVDVVIGGAGAVVGAVAGDKLADAWDARKIYHQTDLHGTSWQYDPKQPQHGWTRHLADTVTGRATGRTHIETAPPAIAERLTFQANSAAVELALAHPVAPRDPYTQPAAAHDTVSLAEASWIRDAQTRQWSRHVVDQVMEHGMVSTHTDIATPQRAAELDAAAQRIIAENLANAPHGIAQRYQAVYTQRDWQRHGPMPDAVTLALKTPANTLAASDGATYTRSHDGQWNAPGGLWGTHTAEGNVRNELDATFASVQSNYAPPAHVAAAPPKAVQAPPLTPSPEYLAASAAIQRVTAAIENGDRETLRKEGEAFTNSPHGQAIMAQARALVEREEQERARQQAQRPPRDPREAGHPDHALYQSIRTQVETLHTRNGICPSNKTLDHLTASVALHARENGWTRVDQVHFNADNSVIVAERKSDGFDAMPRFSSTHIQQAMQTPPEQAYQQMAAETQRQADVTQMVQQQMAQSRQGPSLGR